MKCREPVRKRVFERENKNEIGVGCFSFTPSVKKLSVSCLYGEIVRNCRKLERLEIAWWGLGLVGSTKERLKMEGSVGRMDGSVWLVNYSESRE